MAAVPRSDTWFDPPEGPTSSDLDLISTQDRLQFALPAAVLGRERSF
ncbi:MAG: hypothetical protein ABJC13_03465 [Acidobacteriota bacterium]